MVSSLGFSWWQEGPPHTQSLKDLHLVGAWIQILGLRQDLDFISYLISSPGDGDSALQHLRVLEGFLPSGARRLQLYLHFHNRCFIFTHFKFAGGQILPVSWFHVCFCTTGSAGEKLLMPGTGFLTIGAASSLAFCQVLREEYPQLPCKLNQVVHQPSSCC